MVEQGNVINVIFFNLRSWRRRRRWMAMEASARSTVVSMGCGGSVLHGGAHGRRRAQAAVRMGGASG
jgi:hypothetical protein